MLALHFYLNLWLKFSFVNTHWYLWILKKYKGTRITNNCTGMDMGMRQIFIQRVEYMKATARSIDIPK